MLQGAAVGGCWAQAVSLMLAGMFTVSEAEASAIRAAYEQRGELSATVELRRRFPASRTPKLPRVRRMTKAKLRG